MCKLTRLIALAALVATAACESEATFKSGRYAAHDGSVPAQEAEAVVADHSAPKAVDVRVESAIVDTAPAVEEPETAAPTELSEAPESPTQPDPETDTPLVVEREFGSMQELAEDGVMSWLAYHAARDVAGGVAEPTKLMQRMVDRVIALREASFKAVPINGELLKRTLSQRAQWILSPPSAEQGAQLAEAIKRSLISSPKLAPAAVAQDDKVVFPLDQNDAFDLLDELLEKGIKSIEDTKAKLAASVSAQAEAERQAAAAAAQVAALQQQLAAQEAARQAALQAQRNDLPGRFKQFGRYYGSGCFRTCESLGYQLGVQLHNTPCTGAGVLVCEKTGEWTYFPGSRRLLTCVAAADTGPVDQDLGIVHPSCR